MLILIAAFVVSAIAQCGSPGAPPTIVGLASGNPDLSTLVSLVTQAGLVDTLSGTTQLTVFAPTNEAISRANLPSDLSADQLRNILLYHVVAGSVRSTDLQPSQTVATQLADASVNIEVSGGQVTLDSYATVTSADIAACNGVVHVIDHLLIPPCAADASAAAGRLPSFVAAASADPELSKIVSLLPLVQAAGDVVLLQALGGRGPFTGFLPTNSAIAASGLSDDQMIRVLAYHAGPGRILSSYLQASQEVPTLLAGQSLNVTSSASEGVRINGDATVVQADVQSCQGVIHKIDKVLIPPCNANGGLQTIVGLAAGNPDLSTLVSLVTQASLVDTLSGGSFTVFAPRNSAFGAISLPTLTTAQIAELLTYHVVAGRIASSDLSAQQTVTTLSGGQTLDVTVDQEGRVKVGPYGATVVSADNIVCNGIVHVIDQVLIPPTTPIPNIVALAQSQANLARLVDAVVQANLASILAGPGPMTVFAPTNAALEAFDPRSTACSLTEVLLYHVFVGRVLSSDLAASQVVTSVQGGSHLVVAGSDDGVFVNGAKSSARVIQPNLVASNGVVHVIDAVLLPDCGRILRDCARKRAERKLRALQKKK